MLSQEVIQPARRGPFPDAGPGRPDVVLILDDAGIVRYATPSAARLYGDIAVEGTDARDLAAHASAWRVDHALRSPSLTRRRARCGRIRTAGYGGSRATTGATCWSRSGYTDLRADDTVAGAC